MGSVNKPAVTDVVLIPVWDAYNKDRVEYQVAVTQLLSVQFAWETIDRKVSVRGLTRYDEDWKPYVYSLAEIEEARKQDIADGHPPVGGDNPYAKHLLEQATLDEIHDAAMALDREEGQ